MHIQIQVAGNQSTFCLLFYDYYKTNILLISHSVFLLLYDMVVCKYLDAGTDVT